MSMGCAPRYPGTRKGVRTPVRTASQDFSGLRLPIQTLPTALTDLRQPRPGRKTAARRGAGPGLLRWALRVRPLWAPQSPLSPLDHPKSSRCSPRLVQPRIVWRLRATRILHSLGADLGQKWGCCSKCRGLKPLYDVIVDTISDEQHPKCT